MASNLGYPSDINLYQSYKGMSVAAQAVRAGGAVILAAECSDGLGLAHFQQLLAARQSPQELLAMIQDPAFHHFDQWGVQVGAMVQVKVESYLYSSLSDGDVKRAHMRPCADIGQTVAALRERLRRNGEKPTVLVLPYGQLTVPRVSG